MDLIVGGLGNDHIDGGAGTDVLLGGSGDDRLQGGSGIDFMFGQAGNDKMDGGADMDFMWGGTGNDCMHGGNGTDFMKDLAVVTIGGNYYLDGQDVKLSADVGFGLNPVNTFWTSDQAGWRIDAPGVRPQIVVRTQFQLLF